MLEANKAELGPLWKIVTLLADGEFHSGEKIGDLLGVSRAAVWKHLQRLEGFGVQLSSAKGRGYRIEGGLDLLDSDTIKSQMHTQAVLELNVLHQLDSTNSYLLRQTNPAKKICFAEYQSAGRGRRGRTWVSPLAQHLYCSIGWEFEGGIAVLEGLSLAIGVAIARALGKLNICDSVLKWPNDILYNGKKLGGVLIEVMGDPAGYCQVVVGVGLNVALQPHPVFEIDQPWIALNSILTEKSLPIIKRNSLAAVLIDELVGVLQNYQNDGFSKYQSEWMERCAYLNQAVELRNGLQVAKGTMAGVTSTGALCLQTGDVQQIFHGGEVSLRSAL